MVEAGQTLQKLLASVGEAARFESVGQVSTVLPGLEVKGVGPIGLPVSPSDAKRIIGKASQAPYGRGEATIVDTEVRKVWQLEPSQFELRNTTWSDAIAAVAEGIKNDLGIHGKVTAELYKLIVYEKGSFFKPHRDTEKIPRMFATLIVCLPSRHEGGTLVLKHDGQTKQIDFGGRDSEFQSRYVAFYADCQHEVRPVKAGYRICLVYNLAHAGNKQPEAPKHAPLVSETARLIGKMFSGPDPLKKLAIPFTHQYTEANFAPNQLKGIDRTRAEILVRAAESLEFQAYFALLKLHQVGIPDYGSVDYDNSWDRRQSQWTDDEDDYDDTETDAEGEFEEVFDEELKLEHWCDPEGREKAFGTIDFKDDEILGMDVKEGWSFKQEIREATGNEGATMERWYRHAVLVLWPRQRHFEVLAVAGPASAVPALEELVNESKSTKDLLTCGREAEAIIENWPGHDWYGSDPRSYSGPMLRLLARIGIEMLATRFVREVLPKSFNGSEGRALHDLCQAIGWKAFTPSVKEFLSQQAPSKRHTQLNQLVTIVEHVCCDPPALTKVRREACALIASELWEAVERWDEIPQNRQVRSRLGDHLLAKIVEDRNRRKGTRDAEENPQPNVEEQEVLTLRQRGSKRIGVVASMVRLLSAIGASERLAEFLSHVFADTEHYDLRQVVIPDTKFLFEQGLLTTPGKVAASRLLRHCLDELREATAQPPVPPADWKREAKLGCKCKDCGALSQFLRNPTERVARFPMNKLRRMHLHQKIDEHQCEVTHVTERRGSPQTLVCTKTQATYERLRTQYKSDQVVLAELEKLAHKNSTSIRASKRN